MSGSGDTNQDFVEEKNSPFPLTELDRWVLSQTDEEFKMHNWEDVKDIIATNRLDAFKRKPSDLRRYMAWYHRTIAQYGSVTNYLIEHRLPWGSPPFKYQSNVPFEDPADYKILVNDWPYGLDNNITHLVVWSKTPIATDDKEGDVTLESRKIITNFVNRVFTQKLDDPERVIWFKNWVKLQSVRALEHVHVLVKDASQDDLKYWTRYEQLEAVP